MNSSSENNHGKDKGSPVDTRSHWALIGFLAVAAFFLLAEHRAHLLGLLPWLLLLACPLMHLFHHGGHGHHRREAGPENEVPGEKK